MTFARELAQRVCAIRSDDLSEEAQYWNKIAVLDTVGVALAGTHEEAFTLLESVIDAPAGGPSLVLGSDRRVSALDAALLNGTAAHTLDFDNTIETLIGHISAVSVPALIAGGEAHGCSGADLLLGHAAAVETTRIGLALNPEHSEKGWHPTSTLGVIAVAAGCSRLLALSVEQTEMALALSASLAAGIKANFGTMTKPLHAGQCARGGLMAALLARKGYTASAEAFEHKQGFFELFGAGRRDIERVFESWGKPLLIVSPGASYKIYPCCYGTHSPVQAALDLVREYGPFEPDQIERIESRTTERALAHTNRPRPTTGLEAKFSVQYCVARALIDGKVGLDDFEREAWVEPRVRTLLERVHASTYDGPFYGNARFDARLKVVLRDGRVLEAKADEPAGRTVQNPVSRDAVDAKFVDCAKSVLGEQGAEAARARIWALDSISVRELTAALERNASPAGVKNRAAA